MSTYTYFFIALAFSAAMHTVVLYRGLRNLPRTHVVAPSGWEEWAYTTVVSPVTEEIIYRGLPLVLYTIWPALGLVAAGVSGTLFVYGHKSNAITRGYQTVMTIAYTVLAFSSSYTLLPAIVLHSANNAMNLCVQAILSRRAGNGNAVETGPEALAEEGP